MQNKKITQAIAEYLEQETYFSETLINDQKTRQFMRINVLQSHSDFCQEIARELAAAIAPHMEAGAGTGTGEVISVGKRVRIIALLDHGSQDGHCLPIGHVATVQEIDTNDHDLIYRLSGHNVWVSRGEIEAVE